MSFEHLSWSAPSSVDFTLSDVDSSPTFIDLELALYGAHVGLVVHDLGLL